MLHQGLPPATHGGVERLNLSPIPIMPTLMSYLDAPLRLRSSFNRPRHQEWWRWITFVLGLCLGWILHTHLG